MNRLRALPRRLLALARRTPGVRRVVIANDLKRRTQAVLRAGIVDPAYYAPQIGADSLTEREAVAHYVRQGFLAGLSPAPLLESPVLAAAGLGDRSRPALYDYVVGRRWDLQASLLWDTAAYAKLHPTSRQHPGGPVGHLRARIARGDDAELLPRQSGRQLTARETVATAHEATDEWVRADQAKRHREPSRVLDQPGAVLTWPAAEPRPLVSVVLATWNRAGQLPLAVASVTRQSWAEWELIIADDGSTDDSAAVIAELASRDSRIRPLLLEHAGVSATRNAGISDSRGEFVAFLDSDNEWEPGFLEAMMAGLRAEGAERGFATLASLSHEGTVYRQTEPDIASLQVANTIDLNTLVVSRRELDIVGWFDTALRRAVDYDLVLRLAQRGRLVHVPVVGAIYDNSHEVPDRISTTEARGWNNVVRLRSVVPAAASRRSSFTAGVTVIQAISRHDPELRGKLAQLRDLADSGDAIVHVAALDPTVQDWMVCKESTSGRDGIKAHLFPVADSFSFVVDSILPDVETEYVVLVEPTLHLRAAHLQRLVATVASGEATVAQPLILRPNTTLAGVGSAWPEAGELPVPVFAGHPQDDAARLGETIPVRALWGATLAVRTRVLTDVGGLDPLLTNDFEGPLLSKSIADADPEARFVVLADVVARRSTHLRSAKRDPLGNARVAREKAPRATDDLGPRYEQIGLRLDGWRVSPAGSEHPWEPIVVRPLSESNGRRSLRWAIKIAAPWGAVGETWGDTHFARSLADSLRRLGQEVSIDFRESHRRVTGEFDDVSLVIRGLDRFDPLAHRASMLWVISHPDMVTRSEAAQYDRVFAASLAWSAERTASWGMPVDPLLQCTDSQLFAPTDAPHDDRIVFVGNSRNVPRPAVVAPVAAGLEVEVHGSDWAQFIPKRMVHSRFVPNAELAGIYERSGVVLNDHWDDMRRDGFLSNRLFDVVAAGGRIITDEVEGLQDVFGSAVAVYRSPDELVEMLKAPDWPWLPDQRTVDEGSRMVRAEHSFDHRAEQLLAAALAAVGTHA